MQVLLQCRGRRARNELSSGSRMGSPRRAALGLSLSVSGGALAPAAEGSSPQPGGIPRLPLSAPAQHRPATALAAAFKRLLYKIKTGERRVGAGDSGSLFVICIVCGALN